MNKGLLTIVVAIALLFGTMVYFGSHQSDAPQEGVEVLCIGIMSNTANPARFDARVRELCAKVGVFPLPEDR